MGLLRVLIPALMATAPAFAESQPLTYEEAVSLVGSPISTADDLPLGHLVAVQTDPSGAPICIVRLHDDLKIQTSFLQIEGVQMSAAGHLQVTDLSDDLKRLVGIPF